MDQFYTEPVEPAAEERIHLRDYLQIINKRRFIVLTVFVIITVLAVIMGLGKKPLYTSSATVLVERNDSKDALGPGYYRWDPEFLPTQIEIIKSKSVTRRVVDILQLDTRYHSYFFPTTEEKKSVLTSIGTSVRSFLATLFRPDREQAVESVENEPVDEADIIASRLQGGITVQPVRETRVLNIMYTDRDPRMAQRIADALVQAYMDVSLEIKLSSTQQSLKWMTAKAAQERKKLEAAERALQKYKRENNLVTVENKLAMYPQKLSQVTTELAAAESRMKELEALYNQIVQVQDDPKALETIPALSQDPTIVSLDGQILKAQQLIKELSKKYGRKHPKMIKARDDLNILLQEKKRRVKRIIESTRKEYELARSKQKNLKDLLAQSKDELLDVNERFVQYTIMKREVEANRALYDALTASLKKASLTEESQSVNIWVMRPAELPMGPSNRNPKRILVLGMILGLAGGIGLAFFIEYLDNSVKTGEDLEQRYGITPLGTVQEAGKNEAIETIVRDNIRSPISESYRLIRSALLLSSADHPPRSLLVTSMSTQDGKTTTSINLARTMAHGSDRVILVDADMRKPRIHFTFGLDNTSGLSSYLSGNVDDNIITTLPDEKISIITSGPVPPNPSELLESKRMQRLLKQLKEEYDFVVIDSPPLGHLVDPLILSTLVDGTVLVARAGKTTYDQFGSGLKKMRDIDAHILGVVVNAMNAKIAGSGYYQQYYQYYSSEQK
jgi:capsular exopolysaccharide synthesis family protein